MKEGNVAFLYYILLIYIMTTVFRLKIVGERQRWRMLVGECTLDREGAGTFSRMYNKQNLASRLCIDEELT